MQVDYSYYTEVYGGSVVPQTVFERILKRCNMLLDSLVNKQEQLLDIEAKVQHLLCCMCDEMYRQEGLSGIVHEKLDGYDITYDTKQENRALINLIRQHLGRDGVLYRGREA